MLLWFELKKTLLAPVIIGFAALSVVLNVVIIFTYDYAYQYVERESEPYNIFEGYETSGIADYYVGIHGMSGSAEKNIREKYAALQLVVDEKAANGDSLSVYFGMGTYNMHRFLFEILFFAIIAEAALLAMFVALMSIGFENIRNTEALITSSKIGWRILRTKLIASLTTGLTFFGVILAVSLCIFFARYDYSAVWNDNVSSSFNVNYYSQNPFITWHSFTVAGYLWATIGVAAGLTVVFGLFGYAVGTFFRSGYASCGVAVALCGLQFLTVMLFQVGGTIRGVLNLTPIMLWINSNTSRWFTEGGAEIIWAHYETIGLIACLVILTAASAIAARNYRRRDLL